MGNKQNSRPPIKSVSNDLGADVLAEACATRLGRSATPRAHVPLDPEHALAHLVSRELDS